MTWTTLRMLTFWMMLTLIALVSLYDCYLTEKYKESLQFCEENPIARLILERDNWKTTTFLTCKAICTCFVLCFLVWLYRF